MCLKYYIMYRKEYEFPQKCQTIGTRKVTTTCMCQYEEDGTKEEEQFYWPPRVYDNLGVIGRYKVNREDYPKVIEEWPIARDMKGVGIEVLISDMCQFIHYEVVTKQGVFFDKRTGLVEFPQLCQYERNRI